MACSRARLLGSPASIAVLILSFFQGTTDSSPLMLQGLFALGCFGFGGQSCELSGFGFESRSFKKKI